MRITKHFLEKDDRTDVVSEVFDRALKNFDYPWKYDSLELHVRDENLAKNEFDRGLVVLDYNHPFVAEKDETGIEALIVIHFFRLIVQRANGKLPQFLESLMAYRQAAKRNPSLLEYLAYNDLIKKRIESVEDFLNANIYWLAFKGVDSHNVEMFREMVPPCRKEYAVATAKLFEALSRDLSSEENMKKAKAALGEIACR